MKCPCGLNEKPDNIQKLQTHLQECLNKQRLPKSKKGYFIVWRTGEFHITNKPKKNETTFDTTLPIGKKPETLTKIGLPTYTPTGSLLAPQKSKRNNLNEKEPQKDK